MNDTTDYSEVEKSAQVRVVELEAELARLREALEKIERLSHPTTGMDDEGTVHVNMPRWNTMGDIARNALKEES